MRAMAIENLLNLLHQAYMDQNKQAIDNLFAKKTILLDRSDEKAASVIRELCSIKS